MGQHRCCDHQLRPARPAVRGTAVPAGCTRPRPARHRAARAIHDRRRRGRRTRRTRLAARSGYRNPSCSACYWPQPDAPRGATTYPDSGYGFAALWFAITGAGIGAALAPPSSAPCPQNAQAPASPSHDIPIRRRSPRRHPARQPDLPGLRRPRRHDRPTRRSGRPRTRLNRGSARGRRTPQRPSYGRQRQRS